MADRVLSIEIGFSLTKVCEMEMRGKTPKILNSVTFKTPADSVTDGMVGVNTEAFVAEFKKNMAEHKIRTKKAVFTVASSRIVTKETTIPFVKETKIKDIVRANLSDYFPVDPAQYMFAHAIVGLVHGENDNGEDKAKAKATGYKLMLFAAPKPLINGYEKLAKDLGLDLEDIDYNGNSLYQASKDECNQGVELIVKIDERSTLLMVLDDGAIAFIRTIPYGIDEALDSLQRTTALGPAGNYEEALDLARRKTVILSNFRGELMATDETPTGSDAEVILADKKQVTDSLSTLVGGIMRVMDYYNSNHREHPVGKVYLTGIGADFSGMSRLLDHEMDVNVRNLTHLAGIEIDKVFKEVSFGEYITVIGAGIAPIGFYPDHDDAGKGKAKKSSSSSNVNTLLIALIVLGLCIIGSAVMVVMTLLPYNEELKKNTGYKDTISRLQPSYDIYQQYLISEANVEYIRQIEKAGVNRNEQILEFFDFMERELPETFCVTSISTDQETITMDATVSSKEEVAYTLNKLKECEIFSFADITSVSLMDNELGEVLYGFTVELSYAPIEDPDAEEETDATMNDGTVIDVEGEEY